jgi:hypothetical protein
LKWADGLWLAFSLSLNGFFHAKKAGVLHQFTVSDGVSRLVYSANVFTILYLYLSLRNHLSKFQGNARVMIPLVEENIGRELEPLYHSVEMGDITQMLPLRSNQSNDNL